jgi:hypothetical protein
MGNGSAVREGGGLSGRIARGQPASAGSLALARVLDWQRHYRASRAWSRPKVACPTSPPGSPGRSEGPAQGPAGPSSVAWPPSRSASSGRARTGRSCGKRSRFCPTGPRRSSTYGHQTPVPDVTSSPASRCSRSCGTSRPSALVVGLGVGGRRSCTRTRVMTPTTCADGCIGGASAIASQAMASSPRSGWADTAGWSSEPCPGWLPASAPPL